MLEWVQRADESVLRWIADCLRRPVWDGIMRAYTSLGNGGAVFIVLAVLFLFFRKTRRAGTTALTALALGALVTNLTVKPLVARPRPWLVMKGFETLLRSGDPNSFPSGHTCAAFAFGVAAAVVLRPKWVKVMALIAAVLMGFSRLYVGVHFPSDVMAGAAIGACCGLLAPRLISAAERWVSGRRR